jgi:hypothetical protein
MLSVCLPLHACFCQISNLEAANQFSGDLVKDLCDCYNLRTTLLNFFPLVIKIREMCELMRRKGH